jgi:hypothetical protein
MTSSFSRTWAVGLLVAVSGCAWQSGERTGGSCPAGEVCSTAVEGLDFSGTPPAGYIGNIVATAEGGTQTIDIHGWSGPYEAVAMGPSFEVLGTESNHVTLHGLDAGASRLRILHPSTGELLDRTDLEVKRIARIGLAEPNAHVALLDASSELAFMANAEGRVVVRLHDAVDDLIVDEGLLVSVSGAALRVDSWDVVIVTAPASGSVAIDATSAGVTGSFDIPVVDTLDAIEITTGGSSGEVVEVELGSTDILCFRGRAGERRVLGATFSFDAAGTVAISEGATEPSACTTLDGVSLGNGNVVVTGPGATLTVPVRVVAATDGTGSASGPLASDASLAYTRGERR